MAALHLAIAFALLSSAAIALGESCPDWQAALDRHNAVRATHQAPALVWNSGIADGATAYSQKLADNGCGLAHDSSGYGENLFMSYSAPSCTAATDAFYNEVTNYQFTSTPWTTNQPNFANIGHFTQVVWKSSAELGCGLAVNSAKGCFVVTCRYNPPGNYVGDEPFLANVLPAVSGASASTADPSPASDPTPAPTPEPTPDPAPAGSADCADIREGSACDYAQSVGACAPGTFWYWRSYGFVRDVCRATCDVCTPVTTRRMLPQTTKAATATSTTATKNSPPILMRYLSRKKAVGQPISTAAKP